MPISRKPIAGLDAIDRAQSAAIIKANKMYERYINQGKVTPANRNQIKKRIAAKTGVYVTSDAD